MKATHTTATSHLKVRDIMTKEPVCADPSMSLRQLARMLEDNEISGAPVVATNGRLIGVVSMTDLLRRAREAGPESGYVFEMLSENGDEESEPDFASDHSPVVQDFMSEEPITASPEEQLGDVAARMAEHKVHRVIVVNVQNVPVGIVTSLDLLKVFPK
jgi:predicted transcriptional regulator